LTKQAADYLIYEGEQYELLGDSTRQLPMVKQYGMQPRDWSTGCYKGYIAEYAIVEQQLMLTSLMINAAADHYPKIGGIRPEIDKLGIPIYSPIFEPMRITGVITIGKNTPENWFFADIRSVHDYVDVVKIVLKAGIVQSVEDISQLGTEIRKGMQKIIKERQNQPGFPFVESEPKLWDELYQASWELKYSMSDES
jgi:hypothetical protein